MYDQIVSLIIKHNTIPSFMSGDKNDITKELAYKDGKYSITLTDKNGVLSDYSFSSSDGNVKVSKSGNKLTISSAVAVSGSVRITAKRNGVPTVSESAKIIAYGDPNLQDVVTGVENADTVAAYINIETPTGTIALKKTSEDGITLTDKNGVLSDYSFSSSDGNVKVSKSGNKLTISSAVAVSGSVRITAKRNGVPTVSESAKIIAYGDPNLQDVVTGVENADTVAAYINIETPTGTIALKKTSEDGVVGGIQFNIKGDNFNKTVTTDKDGNISVEGLFPAHLYHHGAVH